MTLEQMKIRLEELSGLLSVEEEKLSSVNSDLRIAYESGEGDPEALAKEKTEISTRIEAMTSAIRSLEHKTIQAEDSDLREQAMAEVSKGRKRVGGVAGEHDRAIQRCNELLDQFQPLLEKVYGDPIRQRFEEMGLRALCQRFEIDPPDLKILPPSDSGVQGLQDRLQALVTSDLRPPNPSLLRRPLMERAEIASSSLSRLFGSESRYGEILAQAGPSPAEVRAQLEVDRRKEEQKRRDAAVLAGGAGVNLEAEKARVMAHANPRTALGPSESRPINPGAA